MKLMPINCGTLCPHIPQFVLSGQGSLIGRGCLTCRCFLIETSDRLILVDTGLGTQDILSPRNRLGLRNLALLRPTLDKTLTAISQIESLGYQAEDVQDIILTHLHPDHAGGISDFPHARIHVHNEELKEVNKGNASPMYRPQQWSHEVHWIEYQSFEDSWFGFPACKKLNGISENIVLIPLPGHTVGSMGVAVLVGQTWHFHVGDAIYLKDELLKNTPSSALSFIAKGVAFDNEQRSENVERLSHLRKHENVFITCSHDPN